MPCGSYQVSLSGGTVLGFSSKAVWSFLCGVRLKIRSSLHGMIRVYCMCLINGCPMAWELWTSVLSWTGIPWVFLWRWLSCCMVAWLLFGRLRRKIWALIPLCLMWLIWREWNGRHFDGVEMPLHRLKSLFLSS